MSHGVGPSIFSALGLSAKLPPPIGPTPVASCYFRIPDGVLTQIFFPANADSPQYKKAEKKRRHAYREGFILGTARATHASKHLLRLFLSKTEHCVPDLVPEASDIAGTDATYPVIFYSHGLMGCSESYTKTCADLASHGFIVIAFEHEDESGAFAQTASGEVLLYKFPPTPPQPREVVKQFRAPFLDKRVKEVEKAMDFLLQGEGAQNKEISPIISRMNKSKLVLAGHSFGAASTVHIIRNSPPNKFNCALLLDIWPFPLDIETGLQGVPVCLIESEEFVRNDEAHIASQFVKNCDQLWASTYIEGSTHLSFGDATFWFPLGIARKAKAVGKTPRAMTQKAIAEVMNAFLTKRVVEGLEQVPKDFEESLMKSNQHVKLFRETLGEGVVKVRG